VFRQHCGPIVTIASRMPRRPRPVVALVIGRGGLVSSRFRPAGPVRPEAQSRFPAGQFVPERHCAIPKRAPPATQAYSARDPGAGAGLNGAPPTETSPTGRGNREGFWRDVLTARARSLGGGIADVVTGIFCRASARAANEES
jgi:hypothetical protein